MSRRLYIGDGKDIHFYRWGSVIDDAVIASEHATGIIRGVADDPEFAVDEADEELVGEMLEMGILSEEPPEHCIVSGIPGERTFGTCVLEITDRCTLRCGFCYKRASPSGTGMMSLATATEVADRLMPGTRKFQITGGEPTVNPDFVSIVDMLSDRGAYIAVITNGTRIRDVGTEVFRKVDVLQVSLYGTDAESYRRTTGVDSFGEFVAGIDALHADGIPYTLSYSLEGCDESEIRGVFRFASEHGASSVRLGLLFRAGRNSTDRYEGKDPSAALRMAEDISREYPDIEYVRDEGERAVRTVASLQHPFADANGLPTCGGFTTKITVTQEKRLKPCTTLPDICSLPFECIDGLLNGETPDRSFFDRLPKGSVECSLLSMMENEENGHVSR